MMARYIQLTIAEPCQENWDQMSPRERGRFCDTCKKQVLDLTMMNDQQLVAFFRKRKGQVCGRLTDDQLNRQLAVPQKKVPLFRYFLQMVLPLTVFSFRSVGQANEKSPVTQTEKKPLLLNKTVPVYNRIVRGKITDKDGEGIAYASVSVNGSLQGSMSDKSGNFQLTVRGLDDSIGLTVSKTGYISRELRTELTEHTDILLIEMNHASHLPLDVLLSGKIGGVIAMGAPINLSDSNFGKIYTSFNDFLWRNIFK